MTFSFLRHTFLFLCEKGSSKICSHFSQIPTTACEHHLQAKENERGSHPVIWHPIVKQSSFALIHLLLLQVTQSSPSMNPSTSLRESKRERKTGRKWGEGAVLHYTSLDLIFWILSEKEKRKRDSCCAWKQKLWEDLDSCSFTVSSSGDHRYVCNNPCDES